MKDKADFRASNSRHPIKLVTSIVMGIKRWFQVRRADRERIESIADNMEPRIKTVHGYRKRLRRPLNVCQEHCKKIVAGIPGPIYLKHSRDYDDPLINAAFTGSEKIESLVKGLGVNPEHLHTLKAHRQHTEKNIEILKKEIEYKGLSVVIFKRECIEALKKQRKG